MCPCTVYQQYPPCTENTEKNKVCIFAGCTLSPCHIDMSCHGHAGCGRETKDGALELTSEGITYTRQSFSSPSFFPFSPPPFPAPSRRMTSPHPQPGAPSPAPPMAEELARTPEEKASFLSRWAYTWLGPLLTRGYRKPLTHDDLVPLSPAVQAESSVQRFRHQWEQEKARVGVDDDASANVDPSSHPSPSPSPPSNRQRDPVGSSSTSPSLYRALYRAFGREFLLAGVCRFIGDQAMVASPVLLLFLIRFIMAQDTPGHPAPPPWHGYLLVVGLLLVQVIQGKECVCVCVWCVWCLVWSDLV